MNIINRKNSSNAVSNIKNITHLKLSVLLSSILLMLAFAFFIYASFNPKDTAASSKKPVYSDSNSGSGSDSNSGSGSDSNSGSDSDSNSGSDSGSNSSYNSGSDGINGGSIKGNCVAGKKALPIYCIQTDEKKISISFDAAWGADDTIKLLDILDKHNVKTTFFMTGGWVSTYPDMVKEIYKRGHDLGNHSENHKEMSKLNASEQKEEITAVDNKIKELTGYDCFLFRPPYGDYNSLLINTVYGCNHYPVQWDVDSLDWKDYGVDSIIKTVTRHKALGNGSIILMHNGAKFTAKALDTVLTSLEEQGYEIVPVSQLIIRENFHMDGTGRQIED